MHLMIGSEGTLGFISEIVYGTVVEHALKASALIFFPDIGTPVAADPSSRRQPVAAAELMDRAGLRVRGRTSRACRNISRAFARRQPLCW